MTSSAAQTPSTQIPRRVRLRTSSGVAYVVLFPLALSYVFTHSARAVVPSPELGAPYENVSFTTSDGLTLKGW